MVHWSGVSPSEFSTLEMRETTDRSSPKSIPLQR